MTPNKCWASPSKIAWHCLVKYKAGNVNPLIMLTKPNTQRQVELLMTVLYDLEMMKHT